MLPCYRSCMLIEMPFSGSSHGDTDGLGTYASAERPRATNPLHALIQLSGACRSLITLGVQELSFYGMSLSRTNENLRRSEAIVTDQLTRQLGRLAAVSQE